MREQRAIPARLLRVVVIGTALVVAGLLHLVGANPAVSQTTTLVAMRVEASPTVDPEDAVWARAPEVEVALTAQAMTYPFGGGAIPTARLQAVHDSSTLFVRVSWDDSTVDDRTVAAEDFADAVAVQFPAVAAATAPAICMGQADGGVNIWQWRADSARSLPATATELHVNGYVDQYPSTDDLYFPARDVGNLQAQSARPVQDLVAVGFGTLGPASEQTVTGASVRTRTGWSVVFARPFASTDPDRPSFSIGTTTDAAVAAWDGAADDRNGQKSISSFVRLELSGAMLPALPTSDGAIALIAAGTAALWIGAIVGISLVMGPTRRRAR